MSHPRATCPDDQSPGIVQRLTECETSSSPENRRTSDHSRSSRFLADFDRQRRQSHRPVRSPPADKQTQLPQELHPVQTQGTHRSAESGRNNTSRSNSGKISAELIGRRPRLIFCGREEQLHNIGRNPASPVLNKTVFGFNKKLPGHFIVNAFFSDLPSA